MTTDAAELGEIQETLLIPLYGRATETRKPDGLLHDAKAVEMVKAIDYDFARFDGGRSLLGVVLRTSMIDAWVQDFLDEHPQGTVVEIGAGLNTRFERVDNGTLHWIDLDLPDAMNLRSKFFTESDRRHMVAASVLEKTWIDIVKAFPAPYFLIAEGVLIYLDEPDVRRALTLITANFPGAHLVLDTSGRWIIDHQDRHDAMQKVTARMRWACDDPRELERWHTGLRTLESHDLSQLPDRIRPRVPLSRRTMLRAVSAIFRQRFGRYKVNLYRIESPAN
ncbi:class I SAM-dependent methyltransferase [Nocardia pseudovaccinii]|uniref:class I SAM-dependent methyltransferase n=1 Tax=Nocardia pseudovaccinii TaxID=189540 RepID=UPI0007A4A0F5|nr:class I SAM-dependent methyltransferase [Nocardia pseudovaccinii]